MKIKKLASMLLALALAATTLTACGKDDSSDSKKDTSKNDTTTTTAPVTTTAPTTTEETPKEKEPEVTDNDPTVDGKYGHVSISWADGISSYYWGPAEKDILGVDVRSNWLPIDKNGDYSITFKVWNTADGSTEEDFVECDNLAVLTLDWAVPEDLKESDKLSINTTKLKIGDTEVTELDFKAVAETLGESSINDFGNNWEKPEVLRQNLSNEWGGSIFAFDYEELGFPAYNYITIDFTVAGLAE